MLDFVYVFVIVTVCFWTGWLCANVAFWKAARAPGPFQKKVPWWRAVARSTQPIAAPKWVAEGDQHARRYYAFLFVQKLYELGGARPPPPQSHEAWNALHAAAEKLYHAQSNTEGKST